MRLYLIIRALSRGFPLAVLWTYLAMFIIAFAMIFVFPFAPLFLLGLGLAGLVGVMVVAWGLRLVQQWAARRALLRNICPLCGETVSRSEVDVAQYHCLHCAAHFTGRGILLTPDQPAPAATF